jgi:hypothetical protein
MPNTHEAQGALDEREAGVPRFSFNWKPEGTGAVIARLIDPGMAVRAGAVVVPHQPDILALAVA